MIKENLTITKQDSTLAKLCKFCAWFSIVICFLIFALVWLVLFFALGGPMLVYMSFKGIHKARVNHKQHLIAKKACETDLI